MFLFLGILLSGAYKFRIKFVFFLRQLPQLYWKTWSLNKWLSHLVIILLLSLVIFSNSLYFLGPRKSLIINSQPLEKVYHEGEDNPIWWVLSSANVNPFSRLRDKQDNQQTSLIDGNDLKQLDSNYLDDSFQLDESEHSLFPKRGDYSR